jgi:chromate transport protein ChrA
VRVLASSVLLAEALIVLFAALVAKDLSGLGTTASLVGGGVVAIVCLLLCGLLRHRWAYIAGTLVQVVLLASGVVVPLMFFLGGLFALLWGLALYLGSKGERIAAEHRAAAEPPS